MRGHEQVVDNVVPNEDPAQQPDKRYGPGREEPSVVLDLDLWERVLK